MKYVYSFSDLTAQNIEISGGKGANLAKLYSANFPVPGGFIVAQSAYLKCVEPIQKTLSEKIKHFDLEKPEVLKEQVKGLQSIFHELSIPQELLQEIHDILTNWKEESSFSVRSSSTMEDLASAAFAGQHDSFLNCIGEKQIVNKIKACFASLWNTRAILYREQNSFEHSQASMAVVVQEMIPCDVAGVMFSINPVSGNFNECMINANYGLGESVVSGKGDVDHIILDKKTGEIIEQRIATERKIIRCSYSGVQSMDETNDAGTLSIDTDSLRSLFEVTKKIETFYRFPQDIEWGVYQDKLYILQARPITQFPEKWTRDESAERYPYVMTPLSWDFIEAGFHESLSYSLNLMCLPFYPGKWFSIFDNYIYGNQNAVKLYLNGGGLNVSNYEEVRQLIPLLRENFRWTQDLPNEWMQGLDKYLITIGALMAENIDSYSIKECWDFVTRVQNLGNDYFKPNIAISITQGNLYLFFYQLLGLCYKDQHLVAQMLSKLTSAVHTKTKQINRELNVLAKKLKENKSLLQTLGDKGSKWVIEQGELDSYPSFKERFDEFILTHGHREFDIDPYHPTYHDTQWTVLDTIVLNTHSKSLEEDYDHERLNKIQALEAEKKLLEDLPQDLHFFYMEILQLARSYTELDDFEHYQTTRLSLVWRRGLKVLGKLLQEKGVIEDSMDIFFAKRNDLEKAIVADQEDIYQNLTSIVKENKNAYLSNQKRTPQWNLNETQEEQSVSDDVLKGIPGSPGIIEGEVFLLHSTDDFARFPKGAVLVARTTNPAWTPIFYSACAVITESGGPLSHGAVTAREMQIPAVMAIKGVLNILENGQKVKVDGNMGSVFVDI